MRFTNRAIDALKPKTERFEVWADGHRGFGLRVSPAGRKTFIFMYRFGGKARRMTLGRYPAMGLADAYLVHAEASKKQEMGIDPGAELIGKRTAARDAETVADLFGEYMKRHSRPNKKSADADQRLFDKDVIPAWGKRKAKSITRRDAIVLIDGIVDRGSPVMANRALSALKRVWNFGLDRDILDATPFSRIKPPTKETPRDRVLSAVEIELFWNGLPGTGMSEGSRLALKLLLVTAQRRSEVVLATWSEFDFEEMVWSISSERSKNGIANRVPLSPLAVDLLKQIKALSGDSDYLFPSPRNKGQPVVAVSLSHAVKNNLAAWKVAPFTPHDLRRSAASELAQLGISRLVIEKILNHKDKGIAGVYDRYGYDREKRHALDAWGRRLDDILARGDRASNVVALKNAR
jgi:integrase